MANRIVFINEKGGVGKTSACFNASWELAKRGKKVLMVDMDGQRANLSFFCGIDKTQDIHTLDSVFKGENTMNDVIVNVRENLYIIPADNTMVNIGMEAKVSTFRRALNGISDDYDYIMIDVNPSPGWSHYLSLSVADYAVVVMLPDIASLEGNDGVFDSIDEIRETTNDKLKVLGILFNKCSSRTVLARQVIEVARAMAENADSSLFDSKIRNAIVLSENISQKVGITDYAPKSDAAGDIRNFADEIERRLNNG